MKQQRDQSPTDRRGFLKLAGFGTVGAVAATTASVSASAEEPKPSGNGQYRESEHVKRVYELSRF